MPKTTTKNRSEFRCTTCGAGTPVWTGRCPGCDEWNTLVEEVVSRRPSVPAPRTNPARRIAEVADRDVRPSPTGVDELDRVLSGGLVPGSVTLVGGEPGIGSRRCFSKRWPGRLRQAGVRCI